MGKCLAYISALAAVLVAHAASETKGAPWRSSAEVRP